MTKTKRKNLSKKIRFEVFKRDSFTCQYCGRKAPDVILEVDHIDPVSKGGNDDLLNLITSCFDCNRGKGNRELSDNTVLEKQRDELEMLNERRNQIDMMLQWKKELLKQKDYEVEKLKEYWFELTGTNISEHGEKKLERLLSLRGFELVLRGIDETTKTYGHDPEKAFEMLPRVVNNLKKMEEKPWIKDVYYCRGILRNRLRYVDEQKSLIMLEDMLDVMSVDELKDLCKEVRNWTQFREYWESLCGGDGDGN